MELFQVFWDDQRNLFLEFKKEEDEKQLFLPETVKRINLRYEISKIFKRENYQNQFPQLISVKTIYFFNDFMAFSIDLNEINDTEEVQIKILNLTIFLYSGHRMEYSISRTFILSEICINEDCYANFSYEEIISANETNTKSSATQEKFYHEFETDLKNHKERGRFVYEKSGMKNISRKDPMMSLIRQNTEAIKSIVEQLKELNSTLKNMSLNNVGYVSPGLSQSGPPMRMDSSYKPKTKINIKPPAQLPFLPELKGIFEDEEKFKNYLKPMSEEDLKAFTLNDEDLEKKQSQAIKRQIKRLEKEESEKVDLKDLKKP
jgi:hypothetical protein